MIIIFRQLHSESTDTFPSPCSYFWHLSVVPGLSLTEGRLSENILPVGATDSHERQAHPRSAQAGSQPRPPRCCASRPLGARGRPFQCCVSWCSCPQATKWPLLLTARTPCSFIHPPSGLPVPASDVPSVRHHPPRSGEASGPPALALPDSGVPSSSDTLSPGLMAGT